jgi:hypothetical protein
MRLILLCCGYERRCNVRYTITTAGSLSVFLTFGCRTECTIVSIVHGPAYVAINVCEMINTNVFNLWYQLNAHYWPCRGSGG